MSIQDRLNNLNEYLSSSKKVLGKSVVDIGKVREMVKEIRADLPRELEQSEVIISQKESILNESSEEAEKMSTDASMHSDEIIKEAQAQAEQLVSESEIVAGAEIQANEILTLAEQNKEEIVESAEQNQNEMISKATLVQEESENYSKQRRVDADNYAKEVLFALEERLSLSLAQIRKGIEAMETEDLESQEQLA